ncbi:MAG: hypothetical protein JSV85_03580 [Candidatus Bathyarchaeota archaeon]|nr:MAG: hypothetical protein JSV85_03580 [Candidatus Bathyarchaeota archaeon]
MRKRDTIVLWPVYFDSTKTRVEGRKVPKRLATPSPKIDEVKKAIEQANLQLEAIPAAARPSAPWRSTGFVFVAKKGPKTQTLYRVARELQRLNAET